jgi:hypothetical protein
MQVCALGEVGHARCTRGWRRRGLAPARGTVIVPPVLNTIVLMGFVLAILGKFIGVAWMMRSEDASSLPFTVLVGCGYAMFIGGGLAGGSVSF